MSKEQQTNDDLQDQLVDRALREVIGEETPPDLSEQIMLAATGEAARSMSSLAFSNHVDASVSNNNQQAEIAKHNRRVGIAIAACVLVGTLIVFPISIAQRESARSTQPVTEAPEGDHASVAGEDDRKYANAVAEAKELIESGKPEDLKKARELINRWRSVDENRMYGAQVMPLDKGKEHSEGPQLAKSTAGEDFDSLIDTIVSTIESDAWQENTNGDGDTQPFPNNLKLIISQSQRVHEESQPSDELMMSVTPQIIIQEQEGQRLGISNEALDVDSDGLPGLSAQGEQRAPAAAAPGQMGLQGLINDSYAATPAAPPVVVHDTDAKKQLPSAYYLTDDVQYYAPGPEFELAQEAAELKKRNATTSNSGRGRGIRGEYGGEYSRGYGGGGGAIGGGGGGGYGGEFGAQQSMKPPALGRTTPAVPKAPAQEESDQLAVRVSPVQDLVLPAEGNDALPAFSADVQRWDFGQHPATADSKLIARKTETARQLEAKMNQYHQLSAEIGGATDPTALSKLNSVVGEVRQLQKSIVKFKEELREQDVNAQMVLKQTSAPASVEVAVAKAMDEDATLEGYKAEKYTLRQQIRALLAGSNTGTSAKIRRLEASYGALMQEAEQYRVQLERDIREQIKSGPVPELDNAMTEYVLRRRFVETELANLEKQYEEKVAAIADKGAIDGRLALLEAEIEQLQQELQHGKGPDASGDKYARIHENPFVKAVGEKAVSTFSIDVDTASYANARQLLMQSGQLPPPDAVRIEELVNYFDYDYTPPTDDTPFAAHVEVAGCPWKAGHRLIRVGIKGREIDTDHRPQSNLVFLIDVSGSMNEPAKLPLLVDGMKMLTRELGENDRIAIVVYASSEGLALSSTRGDQQDKILSTLDNLRAGGSTAGGAGIQLAYEIAEKNFIKGGVNRVILATDGDFNVGTTSTGALEELAETKAKETGVFLTVLGFGRGNLRDEMMEAISNAGNGNYHYIDNTTEARKVLVAEMAGTLVTIAKDVKIQIEFNPAEVAAYRLIGYENRMLKTEDFNDDKKDAGEIGAGHTVTAIYEVIPAGQPFEAPGVDPLKYQQRAKPQGETDDSGELLTLKLRYKQPDEDVSTKLEFPITDTEGSFAKASDDFKFASAVASFGMLLRHSQHQGHTSYSAVEEIANDGVGEDQHGYRAEFLQLVRRAKQLAGQ